MDATIEVSEMTDVNTAGVSNGDILKYDGNNWVDSTMVVSEMTDVDTTGASNGDFLDIICKWKLGRSNRQYK